MSSTAPFSSKKVDSGTGSPPLREPLRRSVVEFVVLWKCLETEEKREQKMGGIWGLICGEEEDIFSKMGK